ncbi:Hsp20 family protein [Zavarzinia compransoris]|uniref:Hsp20 family protein n=1 Tax=Zavarzinia marina TaxID=2911065 RepID=UPI001F1EF633|nr:Hsp20 family protein [Zavarzinia marina]MCF4165274.1 Hsp20 family protein [Zavarzinia marina]
MRSAFDFSPLMRSTIGFDRVSRLLDAAARVDEAATSYPPYNIEKAGEDKYRITMAVAGFAPDQLDVTVNENVLVIAGKGREDKAEVQYLHRGIAARAFERRFELADTIKVVNASFENGLLHVDLVREVPEAKKPRQIAIETGAAVAGPRIEHQAAA